MFEQLFKCSTLIQEMILMNSVYMDNNATTSLKKEVLDAMMPVSYTHLRAHETDSYLVCRLLLEKINIPIILKTL